MQISKEEFGYTLPHLYNNYDAKVFSFFGKKLRYNEKFLFDQFYVTYTEIINVQYEHFTTIDKLIKCAEMISPMFYGKNIVFSNIDMRNNIASLLQLIKIYQNKFKNLKKYKDFIDLKIIDSINWSDYYD